MRKEDRLAPQEQIQSPDGSVSNDFIIDSVIYSQIRSGASVKYDFSDVRVGFYVFKKSALILYESVCMQMMCGECP